MVSNSVEYLLSINFCDLPLEQQLILKSMGRQTPNVCIQNEYESGTRTFQTVWYDRVEWLTASDSGETRNRLLCFPCLLFAKSVNPEHAWTRKGYVNLKNLSASVRTHAAASIHINACIKYNAPDHSRYVDTTLQPATRQEIKAHNEEVKQNKEILFRVIDCLLYLCSQALPYRSNVNDNRSHFEELLRFLSQHDIALKYHLQTGTVLRADSESIRDDLAQCIADEIDEIVDAELSEASFYSVEVIDTTDLVGTAQLCVFVRYEFQANICERFLGFFDVPGEHDSTNIAADIVTLMEKYDPKNRFVGLSLGGAPTMSERVYKAHGHINQAYPKATLIHSYGHHQLFPLACNVFSVREARVFFCALHEMSAFFTKSANKHALAIAAFARQRDIKPVPSLCISGDPGNCFAADCVIETVHENYLVLRDYFQAVMTDAGSCDSSTVFMSKSFLATLNDLEFAVALVVFRHLAAVTSNLWSVLRDHTLDVDYCLVKFSECIAAIESLSEPHQFDACFAEASGLVGHGADSYICRDGGGKRARLGTPPGVSNGAAIDSSEVEVGGRRSSNTSASFKALHSAIVCAAASQHHLRLSQLGRLRFLGLVNPGKFAAYESRFPDRLYNTLTQSPYVDVFDMQRLRNELVVVYSSVDFRRVGSPAALFAYIQTATLRDTLIEVHRLLALCLSLPVTALPVVEVTGAGCGGGGQTLSALERTQRYLSLTGSGSASDGYEGRPRANIAMEKELAATLDPEKIVSRFATTRLHRISLVPR